MTHAEASMKTKQAMADSLKRYMEVKSLSKITISAICEDCGINRKTFYYHFKDIYDLLVHAYSAIGKNGFGQFFSSSFERVSLDVIDSAAERQNVELSEEYKGFLCCFYSNALYGLLVTWFLNQSRFDRERFAGYIVFTLRTSVDALLNSYENSKR